MPDEFRPWLEAVEWIKDIEGYSWTEALRRLAVKLAHGDVQAVNGYLTPLWPASTSMIALRRSSPARPFSSPADSINR